MLYKKEKFDQILDYGEKAIAKMTEPADFTRSPESDNAVVLYLAAAAKLGTEDALNRARTTLLSYKSKLGRNGGPLRLKQIMLFHLLCLKNNKFSEALEALADLKVPHYEFLNTKAGVLARLGRMDECLIVIDSILNEAGKEGRPKFVFSETVS